MDIVYDNGSKEQYRVPRAMEMIMENLFLRGSIAGFIGVPGLDAKIINVLDYGADRTGATNSDAAFAQATAAAEAAVIANPFSGGNRGGVKIVIPAGQFRITQPEVLMRSSFTNPAMGYSIEGAGKGITQVYFDPPAANSYLLSNADTWSHLVIRDLSFVGDSTNANFMHSNTAVGNAQNYVFDRVRWDGVWNNIFLLDGFDVNSEFSWFHCNFNGSFAKGVYAPAATASDQFLNYNFYATNFETYAGGTGGDFLDFGKGGNINIWGGSFIHQGTGGGTMFRLGKTNPDKLNPDTFHAQATPRFICIGARIEHHNANSKLLELNWGYGNVKFLSCDNTSPAIAAYTNVNVDCSNATPILSFDSCGIQGRHSFLINGGSQTHRNNNIKYDKCYFTTAVNNKTSDVIVIDDNTFGGGTGGRPAIEFKKCRGANETNADSYSMDTIDGWTVANRALLEPKWASIRHFSGKLPKSGDTVQNFNLPPNAIILSVLFLSPAGAVASTANAAYTIQTSEGTPTVVGSLNSANASLGFNTTYTTGLPFYCNTDAKRQLVLTAGAATNEQNPTGVILVQYIG